MERTPPLPVSNFLRSVSLHWPVILNFLKHESVLGGKGPQWYYTTRRYWSFYTLTVHTLKRSSLNHHANTMQLRFWIKFSIKSVLYLYWQLKCYFDLQCFLYHGLTGSDFAIFDTRFQQQPNRNTGKEICLWVTEKERFYMKSYILC